MVYGSSDVRDCFCLRSRRAARHLTQTYDRALRSSGLRVTQFQLLAAVGKAEPVTQQTLARLMGMDRTTLTRNLALLQSNGFVRVEAGPQDRREHHHFLTGAGRNAVAKALPLWRSAQEHVARQLSMAKGAPSQDAVFQVLSALGMLAQE